MEVFDITKFNENKNEMNAYSFTKDNEEIVYQREKKDEYIQITKQKDSLFEFYNSYFKTGALKSSVKRYPKAFALGNLKEYDEKGNLIKEKNLDKPFTYSWENVKEYLVKHKVSDIQTQVIGISRWSDEKATTWTIEFNGAYDDIKGRYVIKLNGKTGEELEVKLFKGKGAIGETGTTAVYETIYKKDN